MLTSKTPPEDTVTEIGEDVPVLDAASPVLWFTSVTT
jgi:hypothetical protein